MRRYIVLLAAALTILLACEDDPVEPQADPYLLNLAAFTEFEFISIPVLFCLEAGSVRRMLVTRESGAYSVELTHIDRRYCANSESLLTSAEPSRPLTPAEITSLLAVSSRVEINRALPDSCLAWSPFRSCVARWDNYAYNRECNVDHLSEEMVGRLFALVDSIDTASSKPPANAEAESGMRQESPRD